MNLTGRISEKCDPGFRKLVTLEFYDGLESGVAFDGFGGGAWFKTVGDSSSGLYRAFALSTFKFKMDDISTQPVSFDNEKIVFLGAVELAELQATIKQAEIIEHYLTVGSPYMDWLAGVVAGSSQVERASKEGFKFVHQLIKRSESSHEPNDC